MGLIIGPMVANMLANGRMVSNMVRVGSPLPQELNVKGSGRMVLELAGKITRDFLFILC